MADNDQALRMLVIELEREMRAVGEWTETAPDDRALASSMPFCYDTLPFNEWLQWVFLPRINRLLDQRQALPLRSDMAPLAEVWFEERGIARQAERLMRLIRAIDNCLSGGPLEPLH